MTEPAARGLTGTGSGGFGGNSEKCAHAVKCDLFRSLCFFLVPYALKSLGECGAIGANVGISVDFTCKSVSAAENVSGIKFHFVSPGVVFLFSCEHYKTLFYIMQAFL